MSTPESATREVKGMRRALCCQCGQLRTVSARFVRRDANLTYEVPAEKGGWRMTITLKCGHCGRLTRHAKLRDGDPYRDWMEHQTPGWVPGL
jgi:hypothetical protein